MRFYTDLIRVFTMIHLIIGYQGSGKTLYLARIAHNAYRMGLTVYSNVKFNFPYKELDYKDIVDCKYEHAIIVLDEIHLLLPARASLSKRNREICDGFLSMVRKKNLDVYGTTQTLRKVDIRFREEADYYYECQKYAYIGGNWTLQMQNQNLDPAISIMINIDCTEVRTLRIMRSHFIGNSYFRLFDTSQIIKIRGV